jgi:hypothetical protein
MNSIHPSPEPRRSPREYVSTGTPEEICAAVPTDDWTIKVRLEQTVVHCNGSLAGVVYLNLPTEQVGAESLQISVVGREKTSVKWFTIQTSINRQWHYDTDQHVFLELTKEAHFVEGVAHAAGMFEYPFSFEMGGSLPCSFKEIYDGSKEEAFKRGDTRGGWCVVEYFVEARLKGTDMVHSTGFIVQPQSVAPKPKDPEWLYSNHVEQEVKKCCRTTTESFSLKVAVDQDYFIAGSSYPVWWNTVGNVSSEPERMRLVVNIFEKVDCKAGGRKWHSVNNGEATYVLHPFVKKLPKASCRTSIAESKQTNPVAEAPKIQISYGSTFRVAPVGDEEDADGSEDVVSVDVPDCFRTTFEGMFISCTHEVEVILCYKGSTPNVCFPVNVKSKVEPSLAATSGSSGTVSSTESLSSYTFDDVPVEGRIQLPSGWSAIKSEPVHLGIACVDGLRSKPSKGQHTVLS